MRARLPDGGTRSFRRSSRRAIVAPVPCQRRTERMSALPLPVDVEPVSGAGSDPATVGDSPLIRGVDRHAPDRPRTGGPPASALPAARRGRRRDRGLGSGREREDVAGALLDRRRGAGRARRLVDGRARRARRAAVLAVGARRARRRHGRRCAGRPCRPGGRRGQRGAGRAAALGSPVARRARGPRHRRSARAALGRRAGVARALSDAAAATPARRVGDPRGARPRPASAASGRGA